MRYIETISLASILFFLLIASLYVYDIEIPVPGQSASGLQTREAINITVYRLYVPESPRSGYIDVVIVLDPGDRYVLRVNISSGGEELRGVGSVYVYTGDRSGDITLYIEDPQTGARIPMGVYRGFSFDTVVQVSEYSAYIVVERVLELRIPCLPGPGAEVYLRGLRTDRTPVYEKIGLCRDKEIVYRGVDLARADVYLLDKCLGGLVVLRDYYGKGLFFSLRDNTVFSIVLGSSLLAVAVAGLVYEKVYRHVDKRAVKKRSRR